MLKHTKIKLKKIIYPLLNIFKKRYIVSNINETPNESQILEEAKLYIKKDHIKYLEFQKLFPYTSDNNVEKVENITISYFNNVYVDLDNGIALSENLQIIQESKKYPTMNNGTYLSKLENYEEIIADQPIIVINGALNAQYYHIWFDSLIKLYYLNKITNKPIIILWDKVPKIYKDIIYKFNDLFEIKEEYNRFIKVNKYGVIKNLSWAKHAPYYNPKIRDFFVKKLVLDSKIFSKYIYIKRKTRSIINAIEVENIFLKRGFELVYLEDLNIFDQIYLFNNAEIIAGLHGAGFANLMFASPKLKVIELQNYAIVTTYYFISQQLNLDYYYLLPNEYDFDKIKNPYSESKAFYNQKLTPVSFDINRLKQLLDSINY